MQCYLEINNVIMVTDQVVLLTVWLMLDTLVKESKDQLQNVQQYVVMDLSLEVKSAIMETKQDALIVKLI